METREEIGARNEETGGISRRLFLGGVLAAGAIATTAGLAGCASEDEDGSVIEQERTPVETLECDIVVCGTGTAGVSASLRALELGARVITVEGLPSAGGTSRFTEGVFGVGDRLCQEFGVDVTEDQILNSALEYSHHAANAPLLRKFIHNAGDTINWLMDNGVGFTRLLSLGGSPAVWHTFDEGHLVGEELIDVLVEKIQASGGEIRYSTKADELLLENGTVAGIYATNADGDTIQINAPAVVLCCGGFSDNAEMFTKYVARNVDDYYNNGAPGRNGEGIQMGLSAGAEMHLPGTVMWCGGRVLATDHWYSPVNLAFFRQFNFRVNEHAVRFLNEARIGDFTAHGNALLAQNKVVSIIDQSYLDILMNVGLFYGTATMGYPTGVPVPEMQGELEANEHVVIADTLDEIAEAFDLDPAALKASVERYNGFAATGVDEDFGKPAQFLQALSTPPYYAAKLIPSFFTTCGGLKVDTNIRVQTTDGGYVPGLYACGSDAGGLYGHCYDVSAASGSQQGWAATSGRLAAEHALQEYLQL